MRARYHGSGFGPIAYLAVGGGIVLALLIRALPHVIGGFVGTAVGIGVFVAVVLTITAFRNKTRP